MQQQPHCQTAKTVMLKNKEVKSVRSVGKTERYLPTIMAKIATSTAIIWDGDMAMSGIWVLYLPVPFDLRFPLGWKLGALTRPCKPS